MDRNLPFLPLPSCFLSHRTPAASSIPRADLTQSDLIKAGETEKFNAVNEDVFYWNMVDLQGYVSFSIQQSDSVLYMYMYTYACTHTYVLFQILSPYKLLHY